jgi:hypothetical protein
MTHFYTTVSTFHDWFWCIGMRPHGSGVCFSYCPSIVQIFSSVECCLSVSEVTCILDGMRPSFNHWMYLMLPKSVGILVKIFFYAFTFFLFKVILLFVFSKPWTEQASYIENWFWCSWEFYQPSLITNIEALLNKVSKLTNCLFYTYICNCGHMVCKDKVLTEGCNKSLWVVEIHLLQWWPG